jgi:hypothetical protein
MPTNKAAGINPPPDEWHPATPPHEKTGVSYAQAAVRPPKSNASNVRRSTSAAESAIRSRAHQRSEMSDPPPQSSATAVEKATPEERRRRRAERHASEGTDSEALLEQEKAERRRKRREREEQERIEWERYETEKHRRREERRARRERERLESDRSGASSPAGPPSPTLSRKQLHKPVKTGEGNVSDAKHEDTGKPSLVSASPKCASSIVVERDRD